MSNDTGTAKKSFWYRLFGRAFSTTSYPFPIGSQNRDGFERNRDNPLIGCTPEQYALTLSTVLSCVRIISQSIGQLPLNLYERTQTNGRPSKRLATDETLYTILHDTPSVGITSQQFVQPLVASLAMRGEGYVWVKRGALARPVALLFLPPARVSWTLQSDGITRDWFYTPPSGDRKTIPPEEFMRVVGFSLDGIDGVSLIELGARIFAGALLGDAAAARSLEQGVQPTVGFKMEQVLKKEQRREFRDDVMSTIGGAMNAGKPFLLEGGMEPVTIGIKASDAQLLETRAWSVEEICRWFGVDPVLIGHSKNASNWGTGLEQKNQWFLTYCLQFFIRAIEQSIGAFVIPARDRQRLYAKFAVSGLLRGDSAARAALYASGAQNGWLKRSEIRELEDLDFVEGSDDLTAQSNLLPIDKLGQNAGAGSAQSVQDSLKAFLGIIEGAQNGNG